MINVLLGIGGIAFCVMMTFVVLALLLAREKWR
jgi:hypothetical protein